MKQKHVTIIGAGMAGSFMAICLAQRGYTIDVYERYTLDQLTEEASNRSFNLTFYHRGIDTYKKANVWHVVEPIMKILQGSYAHSSYGVTYTPYDTVENPQYVVERPDLLRVLLQEAATYPQITFHFQEGLLSLDKRQKTITIQNIKTKKIQTIPAEVIIGADGINSRVRPLLQDGQTSQFKREVFAWTYKQILIPADLATKISWKGVTENFVHAKNALVLAFPNMDGSFCAILVLPERGKGSFEALQTKATITNFLSKKFPALKPAYPYFVEAIMQNPPSHLNTITTEPWYYKDFGVLVGDAAHAMLPFYGQGVSAAIEDCMTICDIIDEKERGWEEIFAIYQKKRKTNTDLLAYLSQESFEWLMKYREATVATVKNKFDHILNRMFPKYWLPPIYELIAQDPADFQEIMDKHNHRRKIARMLGLSALAHIIYGALVIKGKLYEKQ